MKPSPKFLTAIRRTLLAAAIAATIVALFVTVENWRGDRAWAAVESDLKTRGELPSISVNLPPPIPDDQNLFKTTLLARLLYRRSGDDDLERKKLLAETRLGEIKDWPNLGPRGSSDGEKARPFLSRDFPAIRRIFRQRGFITAPDSDSPVADLLLALEPLRPLLDEVRDAAASRPKASLKVENFSPMPKDLWSVDYGVDYGIFDGLRMALAVRADLELELGRVTESCADILALLRVGNALAAPNESSTWISLSKGVSLHGLAASVINRGLERRLWTESQLAAIDLRLGQLRLLATAQAATRYERGIILSFMDARPSQENFQWPFWFFHGWAQQNKATYSRAIDRDLLGAISFGPDRILSRPPKIRPKSPDNMIRSKRLDEEVLALLGRWARQVWARSEQLRHPYSWLSERVFHPDQSLQGLGSSIDRLALLRISCAFERHRLADGAFPEKLDDLVPQFLPAFPTGIFDGQPLQLRKIPEGGYEIYFFGRDGQDNQGTGDDISLKIPAR